MINLELFNFISIINNVLVHATGILESGHSFSTHGKFSEKLTFLTS